MQKLKTLPYGKPLTDLQNSGFKPANNAIYVWIGINAWKKGAAFSISYPTRNLVLPPYESPFIYHWPVKECDILLYDTGNCDDDYIEEIAYCLLQSDANKVHYISPDYEFKYFHKE